MVANFLSCRAVYRQRGRSILHFLLGGHMNPSRRNHAFARSVRKPSTKGSGAEGALRQALARRRLEERREAEMLKQNLYDVFSDDAQH